MKVNETIHQQIESDSIIIENIVRDIVGKYTKELDLYIDSIKQQLSKDSSNLTNEQLNQIMLKLCTDLYFLGSKQELLGIRQDIAEALRDEKYNLEFMSYGGTVAAKQSYAQSKVEEESVQADIFDRAYKIIKLKYAGCEKFIDVIRKIISARIQEMSLGVRAS